MKQLVEDNATTADIELTENDQLPLLVKIINHILTPGSSLTPFMWISFNILMGALFLLWLFFVFSMPKCIHLWVFGFLGLGLTLSTNWFMKIIFSSGMSFSAQQINDSEKVIQGKKSN
ncbi:unnamed protein product [Phytomonas sp. Hart1]|nr:unnamed protein product [Phytomonas sp. Hart1]|eukprot:CCW66357.1 unnamed protein product [Phytomonas sp. isolate Hart1]